MTIHFNRYSERYKRKALRNHPTVAEERLWKFLRMRQVAGYKFRRQCSVDSFIVDFYCSKVRLAVEIDGGVHDSKERISYDKERKEYLAKYGISILRFTNVDVLTDIRDVLLKIEACLKELDER
jgi:very-short-patch-repair endonuclease